MNSQKKSVIQSKTIESPTFYLEKRVEAPVKRSFIGEPIQSGAGFSAEGPLIGVHDECPSAPPMRTRSPEQMTKSGFSD